MTHHPGTRTAAPPPPRSGIDLKTLWITAVSSAAAAYTCSRLWAPGTLAAAAFTPVLVAIIREALSRSTEVVVRAVPVKGVVRSAPPPDTRAPGEGAAAGAPLSAVAEDPTARVPQPGEISYHGRPRRTRNWRLAVVTGLLGFLVAAVVLTVPELVAGGSASGGGRGTTLFGGTQRDREPPASSTTTTGEPASTVTVAPQETVTVPPQTVTTPPPAVTTPEEPGTTTPPPTTTSPPVVPEPPPTGVP